MTNYEKYEAIVESLTEKLNSGELTEEQAIVLNDAAYTKYVGEGKEEDCDCDEDDCPIYLAKKEKKDSEDDDSKKKKKSSKKKEKDECDDDEEDDEYRKESVDVDTVKLHVFEAFEEGKITEDEKVLFLSVL